MIERHFVDTNVLVYAIDDSEPRKQAVARDLLESHEGVELRLSSQVLSEYFVAGRRLGVPVPDLNRQLATLARMPVHAVTKENVLAAAQTVARHQLSYWDALIIESAASAGCVRLLTEDLTHGQSIRGVEVVNPFST